MMFCNGSNIVMLMLYFEEQPFSSEEVDLSSPGFLPLQSLLHILCNDVDIILSGLTLLLLNP